MSQRQRGFSLIELLIVVHIIGIVAGIAVPNLLASRRSANGASAVEATRLFHQAELTYQAGPGKGSFGSAEDLFKHDFIDGVLAGAAGVSLDTVSNSGQPVIPGSSPGKSGYNYGIMFMAPDGATLSRFTATATPSAINRTGDRSFFVDETGVIRASCSPPKKMNPDTGKCEPEDDTYVAGIAIGTLVNVEALTTDDVLQMVIADPPDPDMTDKILHMLDLNTDGMLTLTEVLKADVLEMARTLAGNPPDDGKGKKYYRPIEQLLRRFKGDLERELAVGIGNEEEQLVPLSTMRKGNPMPLFELALRYASTPR